MSKIRFASAMMQEWEETGWRMQTEAKIRADERRKVFEWITSISYITCDEGEWYVYDTEAQEWYHTDVEGLLELYDERLKEQKNDKTELDS